MQSILSDDFNSLGSNSNKDYKQSSATVQNKTARVKQHYNNKNPKVKKFTEDRPDGAP